jgi:hypothetical protein
LSSLDGVTPCCVLTCTSTKAEPTSLPWAFMTDSCSLAVHNTS